MSSGICWYLGGSIATCEEAAVFGLIVRLWSQFV